MNRNKKIKRHSTGEYYKRYRDNQNGMRRGKRKLGRMRKRMGIDRWNPTKDDVRMINTIILITANNNNSNINKM
jgi:hypothetical protein